MYSGEFENNKRHGRGNAFYPDGSRYEGDWANDKRHGIGCYYFKDQKKYNGIWEDGMPKGVGYYVSGAKGEGGKKLLGYFEGLTLVQPMKKDALANADIDSSVVSAVGKNVESLASMTPTPQATKKEIIPRLNEDLPTPAT